MAFIGYTINIAQNLIEISLQMVRDRDNVIATERGSKPGVAR